MIRNNVAYIIPDITQVGVNFLSEMMQRSESKEK